MRRHTIIGERILGAAPALLPVARVVRSSHEHFDPVAVDAFCAVIAERRAATALERLSKGKATRA